MLSATNLTALADMFGQLSHVGKKDAACKLIYPDTTSDTRRLGWEDIIPKRADDGTLQPQVADGTIIQRPVIDDTQPGGPIERTIQYVAPFTLADREADYRVAWAHFAKEQAND